jgi:hypothetical protein
MKTRGWPQSIGATGLAPRSSLAARGGIMSPISVGAERLYAAGQGRSYPAAEDGSLSCFGKGMP